jgi:hypothetical protein
MITLSSEQIRNAPADVCHWIERQVMTSMGQQAAPDTGSKSHGEHLAACSEEEVAAILAQIQGVLPVVNVFFEFGRRGIVSGPPNVEAFRLLDIAHHTRLQNVGQVIACLDVINQAFNRVCRDADAEFCGFDREGHCFITPETHQNILKLWQKVIASQQIALDQVDMPLASAPNGAATTQPPIQEAVQGQEAVAQF